jgi:hypothetical protein
MTPAGAAPVSGARLPWASAAWCAVVLASAALWHAPSPIAAAAIAALVLPAAAVAAWSHPELPLLALAFFTSGLVPRAAMAIPVGVGRVDGADLALLVLLGVTALRGALEGRLRLRWWPVVAPLLLYTALECASALAALRGQGVAPALVIGELRPALYAAAAAIGVSLLERRAQLVLLIAGLFLVADMTVAVIVLQQLRGSGSHVLDAMATGSWQIDRMAGTSAFGLLRVVPPAHVLVYLMSLVAACLTLDRSLAGRWRLLLGLQFAVLNLGLVMTYTRAQWLASAIALGLAAALLGADARRRLAGYAAAAAPVLLLGLGLTALRAGGDAGLVAAVAQRAASLLTPGATMDSASLEWRLFEVEAAGAAISANPALGVGLGNDYRLPTLFQGEARGWLYPLAGDGRLTRFVHNSYLYVAVKAGLPALAAMLWFAAAFLVSATRRLRRAPDSSGRALLVGVACAFGGLVEWALFEAHLMLPAGMTAVGLMVGLGGASVLLPPGRGPIRLRARPGRPRRAWRRHAIA